LGAADGRFEGVFADDALSVVVVLGDVVLAVAALADAVFAGAAACCVEACWALAF